MRLLVDDVTECYYIIIIIIIIDYYCICHTCMYNLHSYPSLDVKPVFHTFASNCATTAPVYEIYIKLVWR